MKTNSLNRNKSYDKENAILSKLKTKTINKIARSSGFIQRSTGKISPKNLLIGFMIMISKQRNTYCDWATEIGLLEKKTISKQALNERMKPETKQFVKNFLQDLLKQELSRGKVGKIKGVLKQFKNIQIDDSTTLSLPDALVEEFPGNKSRGVPKAQAKIHAMYNLSENNFSFLNVHSFSNNDQSLSADVLPYLQKGDLCLRDMGFTVLEVVSKLIDKGVYFIARKKYCTKVFEVQSKIEVSLLKELRKTKFIDREVLVGSKQQIKVRLVAIPLSPQQAQERRRKARADRDRRLKHTPEYYELLGYTIYITNVSSKQCNAKEIFQLYKLRWNIEIIFKSWKSCFSIEKLIHNQCKNAIRVNCIIYLMLTYIYLFHVIWWHQCEKDIGTQPTRESLSILKLANFFKNHFMELITSKSNKEIIKQMKVHCMYEKREDRINTKKFKLKFAA